MSGKVERLLSLVQMLLDARQPVSLSKIRKGFPEYRDATDDTFHKMFERDKAALRDLGFQVDAVSDTWGDLAGYSIAREASLVADPGFTPDEAAALGLAIAGARGEAAMGAMKLGVASGIASPSGWSVTSPEPDARFATLTDAITRRKRVRFSYRASGADVSSEREIEPYLLRARSGWYLTGFDLEREENRTFRLSRMEGPVIVGGGDRPDFVAPETPPDAPHAPWAGDPSIMAIVAASTNAAWFVQRRTGADLIGEDAGGRTLLRVPFSDLVSASAWLAGFGAEIVVLEPEVLRSAVIAHLRGVIDGS